MAVTNHERFTGFACSVDTNVISDCRSIQPKFGINKIEIMPSGAIDRLAMALAYREGAASITTGSLISLLSWCPLLTGYASSSTGALLQFQQRADGGSFAGASSHATISSPKVFVAIDEISVEQDSKTGAIAKLSIHLLTDGTNPAIAMLTGQSLVGTVSVAGIFKLAAVVYEGAKVLGVQRVSFKTGIKIQPKRSSGYTDADVASIVERKPQIQVSGTNLSLVNAVTPNLSAISAGLTIYLQQFNTSGAPVSGSHNVSIGIAGGVYSSEGLNANGTQDVDGSITADGSGASSSVSSSMTAALP
jgi:hypothetical protein